MPRCAPPNQGGERVYVPQVAGDPIRVVLRVPTEADKRASKRAYVEDVRRRGDALDTEQVVDWTRRLVEQFVVRVEDYNLLAPNGQAMPIATPAEFLEFGEDALVDDVGAEIMRTVWMSDEQKKSSAKPSVSSPAETAPSSGTAVPAGATASPLPGGATTHEPRPASSM